MAEERTLMEQASRTEGEIPRGDTVIRILFSLFFILVSEMVKSILAVVILFELLYTLVTRNAPGGGVRGFADRVIRYAYQIAQYLTYNRPRPPFPFGELPEGRDPSVEPSV